MSEEVKKITKKEIESVKDFQTKLNNIVFNIGLVESQKQQLESADAFVFVVPEWHGMVPPAVKNLFFLFTGVFRHKPAYIVSVSSGSGGRYPIQEMRATAYKNTFLNFIPVNTVIDRLNATIDENGQYIAEKQFVANRVDEGLKLLLEYTAAFQQIRKSDIVQEKRFPNGV